MATDAVTVREYGLGRTQRRDAWWAGPLVTGLVLGGFVVYATFRIFHNAFYEVGPGTGTLENHSYMLAPMYSPLLPIHEWMPWLPAWISHALPTVVPPSMNTHGWITVSRPMVTVVSM